MPMLIHTEIFLNCSKSLHEQTRKRFAKPFIDLLASQQCPEVLSVNKQQIFGGRIVNVEYLHNGCKSGSKLVAADAAGRKHRHHYLNLFIELHELEALRVVEPAVADHLLQEGSQLNGLVLVWLRQVDIPQEKDLSGAVLGPQQLSGP